MTDGDQCLLNNFLAKNSRRASARSGSGSCVSRPVARAVDRSRKDKRGGAFFVVVVLADAISIAYQLQRETTRNQDGRGQQSERGGPTSERVTRPSRRSLFEFRLHERTTATLPGGA